jgi:hypothetical protein
MVAIDSANGQIYTSKETDPALYQWSATLKPTLDSSLAVARRSGRFYEQMATVLIARC